MAIVVTGAAGFIGSNLVGFLREAGRSLVAIDRNDQPALPGLARVTADPRGGGRWSGQYRTRHLSHAVTAYQ